MGWCRDDDRARGCHGVGDSHSPRVIACRDGKPSKTTMQTNPPSRGAGCLRKGRSLWCMPMSRSPGLIIPTSEKLEKRSRLFRPRPSCARVVAYAELATPRGDVQARLGRAALFRGEPATRGACRGKSGVVGALLSSRRIGVLATRHDRSGLAWPSPAASRCDAPDAGDAGNFGRLERALVPRMEAWPISPTRRESSQWQRLCF